MALMRVRRVVWPEVKVTSHTSVARLTDTLSTPGSGATARSTRPTHDAQVIPPIRSLMLLTVGCRRGKEKLRKKEINY
jgi:hypothetical protein